MRRIFAFAAVAFLNPSISTGLGAVTLFVTSGLELVTPALAAPPENANPLFKEYYKTLVTKEGWECCAEADCREVRMEMRDGAPWVFIDKGSFGKTAPDDWVKVPSSAYGTRNQIGAGQPIAPVRPPGPTACWYDKNIRCFDWPLPGI
jgi:hypothetical protein